jgi:hypothetical protein
MAGLFEQFATDHKAELEGIDVTFGTTNDDGSVVKFRVAYMGQTNRRYKKLLEQETKPHIHAIRNETLPAEVDEKITMRLFCSAVLVGWENVIVPRVFGTHEAVPFTPENAMKLFEKLPHLYHDLKTEATKRSNFRDAQIEEDSKN